MKGDLVTNFAEKPQDSQDLINGGFFVMEPSVLDYIKGDTTILEETPLQQLANEGQLTAYKHMGFWQPMDTLREQRILNKLWTSGDAPWKVWS